MPSSSSPRRRLASAALLLLVAAGCGSGSSHSSPSTAAAPEASRSATRILADVRSAVGGALEVHVSGQMPSGSGRIGLDLHVKEGAGTGTLTFAGAPVKLIRVGNVAYMNGGAAFWQHLGTNPAAIQLIQDRWFKFSTDDQRYASLARLLDERALLKSMLKPQGRVVKVGTRTFHGRRVVVLRDTGGSGHSEMYVAAGGAPLPVALVDPTKHASIRFDAWNRSLQVSPPADAVDVASLAGE
jgi:hypothetical protein